MRLGAFLCCKRTTLALQTQQNGQAPNHQRANCNSFGSYFAPFPLNTDECIVDVLQCIVGFLAWELRM